VDEKRKNIIFDFLSKLNLSVKDIDLINQAFLHSSYINEVDGCGECNEKLEFLGDSVLALITVEYLYKQYPDKKEGELSRLKSILVSEATLSDFASEIDIAKLILLGKGEELSGGLRRPSLLADAFEAFLGALYLDMGIEQLHILIMPMLNRALNKIKKDEHHYDFKTCFQLYAQQKYKTIPTYFVLNENGPDHDKIFFVQVSICGRIYGKGQGKSKKRAEQDAAKNAIENLGLPLI